MSTTQWLSVLGIIAGLAEFAKSQGFYPDITGAVLAVSIGMSGILAKGIER